MTLTEIIALINNHLNILVRARDECSVLTDFEKLITDESRVLLLTDVQVRLRAAAQELSAIDIAGAVKNTEVKAVEG